MAGRAHVGAGRRIVQKEGKRRIERREKKVDTVFFPRHIFFTFSHKGVAARHTHTRSMARLPAVLTVRVDGTRVALPLDLAAPARDAAAVLLAALGNAAPPDVLVSVCVCFVCVLCAAREVERCARWPCSQRRQQCGPPSLPSSPTLHPPHPFHSGSNMLAPLCTPSTPWPPPASAPPPRSPRTLACVAAAAMAAPRAPKTGRPTWRCMPNPRRRPWTRA